tara:strand:- start:147 stop:410 length:264 start_codon:yes stop_codon:yes gene_type:complete
MIKLKENIIHIPCDIKTKKGNNIKIGNCIKIKNSKKIFQIVGLNHKRKICWVREWPLKSSAHSTFAVSLKNILIPTICSFEKKEKSK